MLSSGPFHNATALKHLCVGSNEIMELIHRNKHRLLRRIIEGSRRRDSTSLLFLDGRGKPRHVPSSNTIA